MLAGVQARIEHGTVSRSPLSPVMLTFDRQESRAARELRGQRKLFLQTAEPSWQLCRPPAVSPLPPTGGTGRGGGGGGYKSKWHWWHWQGEGVSLRL